jgi:hypothetical protein
MPRLAAAAIVFAALAAPAAPAAAAAADPFVDFVANLATNPKAAAASLQSCQLLLAPSGEARTPCALALADFAGAQTLKVSRLQYAEVKQSVLEYLDVDVQALAGGKVIATYRVIAITGMANPDAGFQPLAMHVVRLISDKDAAARGKAKQLGPARAVQDKVAAAPTGTSDDEQSDRTSGIEEIQRFAKGGLTKDALAEVAIDGGVVYGSAPGQKYTGKSAGASIKKWKLQLQQKDGVTCDGGSMIVYGATNVVATMPDRTSITYDALVVGVVRYDGMSGDHLWSTKLVSFGVPQ